MSVETKYPTTFVGIAAWAKAQGIGVSEARSRFGQYAVLRSIAGSRELSRILVFKGGNALDFIWQPNRSTQDLDFSSTDEGLAEGPLRTLMNQSLEQTARILGVMLRVQSLDRQPPGENKTFITYEMKVGYALPDDRRNRDRMAAGAPSMSVVPLDISLNEPICEDTLVDIQAAHRLRVCSVEDIVAEKLRSLLQQPIRKRNRKQDVLDIAVLLRGVASLQEAHVSRFLLTKAERRDVPVSRIAFHQPEIRKRARVDYDTLEATTRTLFIPFEEAFEDVLRLVSRLDIPET